MRMQLPGMCAHALILAFLLAPLAPAPQARAQGAGPDSGFAPGSGFKRAVGERNWSFPRDHGQHPGYKLEWWYYTGVVSTAGGRKFGYQVTFFRQAIAPPGQRRSSAWAVNSIYMGHAAVSDVRERRFFRDVRIGRDSLKMSGASREAHAVWLGSWEARALPGDPHGTELRIAADGFSLHLTLRASLPPVLHGRKGLDAKGPEPGQASWYYSLPRMRTRGTLTVNGKSHAVQGTSWMDHEFSSGVLAPNVVGWDWLALHLDDGSALMLYRLRREDGSAAPYSSGTYLSPAGKIVPLAHGDAPGDDGSINAAPAIQGDAGGKTPFLMTAGKRWRSPATQGDYPLHWRIMLPSLGLSLAVAPAFEAQEHPGGPGSPFTYWEGVVWATGTREGRPLSGEGYLELTGYAGKLGGALR